MAYKIVLVGASPAEETEFRNLVGAAASRLRQRWDIGTEADADLVVVDVDSVFGHMAWLKASASGRRTAAFTARDSARESDLLLPRPLSLDGVAGVLAMYTLEVGTANAGYANTYEPPAAPRAAASPRAPRSVRSPRAGSRGRRVRRCSSAKRGRLGRRHDACQLTPPPRSRQLGQHHRHSPCVPHRRRS